MNIFLPYEESITESVKALDDKRLNKQILEVYQILQVALNKSEGYKNHPITKHYVKYPPFLILYGVKACIEYTHRFSKIHKLSRYFNEQHFKQELYTLDVEKCYEPFYAAGQVGKPDCIRTTENVSALYKSKLVDKWKQDILKNRLPKWTNRKPPEFFI